MNRPGEVRIEERPVPVIGADDVLVRVGAVGLCGSDIHYFTHGRIGRYVVDRPIVLGHECAGTVTEVGERVDSLRAGDRVAVEPGIPCRSCSYCKRGRYNLCRRVVFMATPPVDGALCEYIRSPADFAHRLPDDITLEEGALVEPLAVGLHAARRARVSAGEGAVILGAGTIGLMTLQAVKACGATTRVVVDLEPTRLELARRLGATHVIDAGTIDPTGPVSEIFGEGPDVVFEAAGAVATLQIATRLVRPGGRIAWIGLPSEQLVPLSVLDLIDKEVEVLGVFRYANVFPEAIRLVASGQVDVRPLISESRTLADTAEAFQLAKESKGRPKVVVTP